MKKATYTMLDGSKRTIEYNENAPCILCGKPVIEVSMAGPTICPWCDSGCPRPEEVRKDAGRRLSGNNYESEISGKKEGMMELKEIRKQANRAREELEDMPKLSWDRETIWDLHIIVEMILDYLQEKEYLKRKEVRKNDEQ